MRRGSALLVLSLAACGGAKSSGVDGDGLHDAAMTLPTDAGTTDAATSDAATHTVTSTLDGKSAAGSAGCGTTGTMGVIAVAINGRTGVAYVPPGYDASKAYPLVFVFHGDGGTGANIRASFDLETPAAGKAIFAYPDGANQTWDDTITAANADMDFVMAVRDQLRTSYCVDTNRTFATGMSRGGYFVNQLACRYGAAEFAAMAPHSGTIDPGDDAAYVYGPPAANGGPYMENGDYDFICPVDGTAASHVTPPKLPPATMVVHGQCDTEGGVEFAEGRRSVEHWGYAARASTTPAVVTVTAPACGTVTACPTLSADPCYVAPGTTEGHDVTFCAIPNMGHQIWCNAGARIWAFFAAH